MENFKFCRVCLLPEDNVMFNSMFADEGIDASNYQKLTNISVSFLRNCKMVKILFLNFLTSNSLHLLIFLHWCVHAARST